MRVKIIKDLILKNDDSILNLKNDIVEGLQVKDSFHFSLLGHKFECPMDYVLSVQTKDISKEALLLTFEVKLKNSSFWAQYDEDAVNGECICLNSFYAYAKNREDYDKNFGDIIAKGKRICEKEILQKDPDAIITEISFVKSQFKETKIEPAIAL